MSSTPATLVVVVLAALVALGGCVTETVPEGGGGGTGARKVKTSSNVPPEFRNRGAAARQGPGRVEAGSGAVADGRAELDSITAADPCGNHMHALAGAMLFYYAVHRQLPPTLDELKAFADTGEELHFTCPASQQPYVYDPAGLIARGEEARLVLYDAEPSHPGGVRWGVVAAPPRGTKPATASAVPLTHTEFRRYAPPRETAPPPAPPVAPDEP